MKAADSGHEERCEDAWAAEPAVAALRRAEQACDHAALERAQAIVDFLSEAYLHEHRPFTADDPCAVVVPVDTPTNRTPQSALPSDPADVLAGLPSTAWIRLSQYLDCSIPVAQSSGTAAFGEVHTLTRVRELVRSSGLRHRRLAYAAKLALKLPSELCPDFDALVARIDMSLEWKRYRKAVNEAFLSLLPPEDTEGPARRDRHVRVWNNQDGTGCLLFTGPYSTVLAAYLRCDAWGRAIAQSRATVFTKCGGGESDEPEDRLADGDSINNRRTMDQLRFDIGLLCVPEVPVTVTHADGSEDEVVLRMPTEPGWLRSQAGLNITVPFLSLTGQSDIPGHFEDQSPVSAAEARRIAAFAPSMRRLLTDPVTGQVMEAVAQKYPIPPDIRTTLTYEWVWCTVPGCGRKAARCEIDHIEPFDHALPARGGPTQLQNLHPLCKHHHNLKTDRKIGLVRAGDEPHWVFPASVATAAARIAARSRSCHADEVALPRTRTWLPRCASRHQIRNRLGTNTVPPPPTGPCSAEGIGNGSAAAAADSAVAAKPAEGVQPTASAHHSDARDPGVQRSAGSRAQGSAGKTERTPRTQRMPGTEPRQRTETTQITGTETTDKESTLSAHPASSGPGTYPTTCGQDTLSTDCRSAVQLRIPRIVTQTRIPQIAVQEGTPRIMVQTRFPLTAAQTSMSTTSVQERLPRAAAQNAVRTGMDKASILTPAHLTAASPSGAEALRRNPHSEPNNCGVPSSFSHRWLPMWLLLSPCCILFSRAAPPCGFPSFPLPPLLSSCDCPQTVAATRLPPRDRRLLAHCLCGDTIGRTNGPLQP